MAQNYSDCITVKVEGFQSPKRMFQTFLIFNLGAFLSFSKKFAAKIFTFSKNCDLKSFKNVETLKL